jgi:3alpha(or 20beta)-hydroxysteroid dehydrogenase
MTITVAKLDGRAAPVTGGARGMGEAHARAPAAEGASVVICDATYSTGSEFCVDGGILAGIRVGD